MVPRWRSRKSMAMVASLRLTTSRRRSFSLRSFSFISSCSRSVSRRLSSASGSCACSAVAGPSPATEPDRLGDCGGGKEPTRNLRPLCQVSRSSGEAQTSPMTPGTRLLAPGRSTTDSAKWSSSSARLVSSTTSAMALRGTSPMSSPGTSHSCSRHCSVWRSWVTQKLQMRSSSWMLAPPLPPPPSPPPPWLMRRSSGVPACIRFTCRRTSMKCSYSSPPACAPLPLTMAVRRVAAPSQAGSEQRHTPEAARAKTA
mmetsp:Transcript_96720/g.306919  ORF Transcript_96720/g.306919 Transcript_96720/m.306919 type:complete len:256 (-) Transcript_96720:7-774(-)